MVKKPFSNSIRHKIMDIYFYLDNIDNRLNSYEKEIMKTVSYMIECFIIEMFTLLIYKQSK